MTESIGSRTPLGPLVQLLISLPSPLSVGLPGSWQPLVETYRLSALNRLPNAADTVHEWSFGLVVGGFFQASIN